MEVLPVIGLGEIDRESDLSALISEHCELQDGDVVIVTSKIVSKSEGRIVECDRTDFAKREQLIHNESVRVLRQRGQLFITETKHGFICANAGIDWSNVEPGHAVLLPVDPDRSARFIRDQFKGRFGKDVAVIVSDTFGRTWRNGVTDIAIGSAGIVPVDDHRGRTDTYGNELVATQVCTVDQIAGAAALVMNKTAQIPVAVVRGVEVQFGDGSVKRNVVRSPNDDLFR